MDNFENVNLAAAQPAQAKLMHAQLQAFFTAHQVDADETAAVTGSGVVDMSDPYDLE